MDTVYSQIVEIESALRGFAHQDLFSASVEFFRSMNYPVVESDKAVNATVKEFIFRCVENKVYYSGDEMNHLINAASISWLFVLNRVDLGFPSNTSNIQDQSDTDSIVFLAVELRGRKTLRSFNASCLTQVLSGCYSSPVLLLFRHEDEVMFAGQIKNYDTGKVQVLLSDWYSSTCFQIEAVYHLSEFCLENFCNSSLHEVYIDMLWCLARPYHTHPEYDALLVHGMFSYNYIYSMANSNDQIDDYFAHLLQCYEENISYYKNMYGDDYVEDEALIEKLDGETWVFEDGDGLFDPEALEDLEPQEEQYFEQDSIKNEENNQNRERENEFINIDEELFEDPIKLLKYLEETG